MSPHSRGIFGGMCFRVDQSTFTQLVQTVLPHLFFILLSDFLIKSLTMAPKKIASKAPKKPSAKTPPKPLPTLPNEVLERIISNLYRPLPPPWLKKSGNLQKTTSQPELAVCMRVNKVSVYYPFDVIVACVREKGVQSWRKTTRIMGLKVE